MFDNSMKIGEAKNSRSDSTKDPSESEAANLEFRGINGSSSKKEEERRERAQRESFTRQISLTVADLGGAAGTNSEKKKGEASSANMVLGLSSLSGISSLSLIEEDSWIQ